VEAGYLILAKDVSIKRKDGEPQEKPADEV